MRDLFSQIGGELCFLPAVRTTTPTAIVIDLQGYNSCALFLITNAGGITFSGTDKIEWRVRESDSPGSGFAAVDAADLQLQAGESYASGGIVRAITAAHTAPTVRRVGYIGNKRYLELLPVFSGTHSTGTGVTGIAVKGDPLNAPVA